MSTPVADNGTDIPDLLADLASREASIFVVDDEPGVRRVVAAILRSDGHKVQEFESAEAALDSIDNEAVALLLTDISMPGMNGIELAREARERAPDLAVIVFTGLPNTETAAESLRLGVSDYLPKPVRAEDLEQTVRRTLVKRAEAIQRRRVEAWLRAEVERRTDDLRQHTVSTLVALVRAMEAKDPYLKGSSGRIARLCERMAVRLGFDPPQVREIGIAGLLHDIGMLGVPEMILHKEAALTPDEFAQVKRHVEIGVSILQPLAHLGAVIEYIRCHHERLNGSGYPRGLKGDEIPLGAQIVGVAESYNALTTDRPYRQRCKPSEAVTSLRASEGVWFSSRTLDALESSISR